MYILIIKNKTEKYNYYTITPCFDVFYDEIFQAFYKQEMLDHDVECIFFYKQEYLDE